MKELPRAAAGRTCRLPSELRIGAPTGTVPQGGAAIATLAALLAYALDANQSLVAFRNHWGWDFLFALIYALFLDRWIKASLLDGASPCDEVDNLRRSVVSPRFLGLATALFLLALPLADLHSTEMSVVLWSAAAALFALYFPSLSAAEPLSLRPPLDRKSVV